MTPQVPRCTAHPLGFNPRCPGCQAAKVELGEIVRMLASRVRGDDEEQDDFSVPGDPAEEQ